MQRLRRLFLNHKGAAHHHIIGWVALLSLLGIGSYSYHQLTEPSALDTGNVNSEEVRKLSYTLIDMHSQFLKLQVDALIKTWDTLPPEQKKQIVKSLADTLNSKFGDVRGALNQLPVKGQPGEPTH